MPCVVGSNPTRSIKNFEIGGLVQKMKYAIVSFILIASTTMSIVVNRNSSVNNIDNIEENISTSESQIINNSNQESSEIITSETSSHSTTSVNVNSEQYIVQEYQVPSNKGSFKSYTDYNLLDRDSAQWNKIQCDPNAYTDQNGLRKVGEYYCVAMGSYYADSLGDLFEIHTEGGSFKVIICDFKADQDTDVNNQCTSLNGCMTEFYVDTNLLDSTAKLIGDISCIDNNFQGTITKVSKLGNYFTEY